jgi:hypothetical protein
MQLQQIHQKRLTVHKTCTVWWIFSDVERSIYSCHAMSVVRDSNYDAANILVRVSRRSLVQRLRRCCPALYNENSVMSFETVDFQLQAVNCICVLWMPIDVGEVYKLGQNAFQKCVQGNLKKNELNGLVPRTLVRLWCLHGTWVVNGTRRPRRSRRWRRGICPFVAQRLVFRHVRNWCQVSFSQRVTTCFTLASVANCLLASCFLTGPKRW